MLPIITALIYSIASAFVIVFMKNETNKRLRSSQPQEIECGQSSPYASSPVMYAAFAGLILASAFAGYTVAGRIISVTALIKVSVCYMAVLAAAVIDIKIQTIPNFIPLSMIFVRLLILVYEICFTDSAVGHFLSSLSGGLLCVLLLTIANRISRGGIGGGDIKLLSGIGFVCGLYMAISTMLLALLCCIAVSSVLLMLKKYSAKDQIPFGPFIYAGYLAVCLLTLY